MCVACLAYLLENSPGTKRILSPSNSLQFVKLLLNKSVYPHEVPSPPPPVVFPLTLSLSDEGKRESFFSSSE
jgi:hypothetical protein